jgi:hypothetical protein
MLRRLVLIGFILATLGTTLRTSGQQPIGQNPLPMPGRLPRGDNPADGNAPDTKKPKEHESSNKDVQQKLEKALDKKNAAYQGSNIKTVVDNDSVTLTGTVSSSMQHEMALQIVRAYAENRRVIDKLAIQP